MRARRCTISDVQPSATSSTLVFESVSQCRLQGTKLVQSLTAMTSLRLSMLPTDAGLLKLRAWRRVTVSTVKIGEKVSRQYP